jgi:acyl carrier protein
MTRDEIKSAILAALRRVAPEIDAAQLRADVPIRAQADLDSMDFLNFMMEIHAGLDVDIPESSYKDVATLDGCISYVQAHNPQPRVLSRADR